MSNKFLDLIKSSEAKWVDFRFTDTKGKEQHVSYPADSMDEAEWRDLRRILLQQETQR